MNISINGEVRVATAEEEVEVLAAQALAQENDNGNTTTAIIATDAAKASGYAKLITLGLTAEEASALTGYTPQPE